MFWLIFLLSSVGQRCWRESISLLIFTCARCESGQWLGPVMVLVLALLRSAWWGNCSQVFCFRISTWLSSYFYNYHVSSVISSSHGMSLLSQSEGNGCSHFVHLWIVFFEHSCTSLFSSSVLKMIHLGRCHWWFWMRTAFLMNTFLVAFQSLWRCLRF